MIVTNNTDVAQRLKRLRMYGETKRYESVEVSGVSRLDELQAALLRVKLRHLTDWVTRRREIAKQYIDGLRGTGDVQFVTKNPQGAYHLFVIRTKHRNALQTYLSDRGVGNAVHYPIPIHLVRAFRDLGYKHGDFPVSEALSREILSLPMFPRLTDGEILRVVSAVKKYFH
jgi:dTDP-4-amino-4,6-dideoxygalactose transaminase